RQPPREGIWDAISLLGRRSPADAFAVLQAIVAEDLSLSHPDRGEILRSWARRAPGDALGEVRARIHAMAGAGSPAADLAPLVQVLADRGQDLSEFAGLLSSIGRELRRLVDEERRADGTGPYYAIEYNPVARTPDNLASLEYAIQVLGEGETRGCRKVLAEARAKSDWK
ncbi:MAG: hypothetical protein HUU06_02975, partial [Planctomycetaceae bacterium]|nr:hypothetical protein [Planctomycetaceae bacterium]